MKSKILIMIITGTLACFLCSELWAVEMEKALQFAGQWPYHPAKAIALDLERDFIFLGDGDRVTILTEDLKQVSSFQVTATSLVGGLFFSASDNLLYIACRKDGLKIYDLTDTENPLIITSYLPDSFETVGVFIDGSKAYLSSGMDGMIILDITDIKEPSMLSQSWLPGGFGISYAIDIYASGDFAFVADLYNGLHIVDVSNPEEPDYIKGIALAGATDIEFSDAYLYMATQTTGMAIIDISTPEDTYVTSIFAPKGVATSVRVDGTFAFISYNSISTGIRVLDITNKTDPFHDPAWVYAGSSGSSIGLFPDENILFFANDQFGLQKVDITDKSNMHPLASHNTPADALAIDVSGNYIYTVDNTVGNAFEKEGLRIHEITTANQAAVFTIKGFCATPGEANDIMVSSNYAYIADGEQGLQITDISDKTDPKIVGNFNTPGNANGIFIDGNFAYVADGDQGITIIDITDKTNPILTGTIDTGGYARKIFVYEDYAFVAAEDKGLIIINISNKTSPVITGIYDTPGTARGVFIKGIYAYVADGKKGISIVDITDKTNPILTGTLDTDGFSENLSVSVDYVYVADGLSGLCSIDASVPSLPTLIKEWSYNSPGIATDVYSGYSSEDEELYAFIADGAAGIIAVSLSIDDIHTDTPSSGSGGGGCFIQALER